MSDKWTSELQRWLRRCIEWAQKHGLGDGELRELLGEVMPSESDTPAPSLPGPPLASPT